MTHELRHERLRRRAELLARLRALFAERGFLEVETPLLDREIIPELHIEPFGVIGGPLIVPWQSQGLSGEAPAPPVDGGAEGLWLQASPELHMKRLLAEGLPALYQVTRSFRRGERGQLHNPEFTIVEWYRAGDGMVEGMELLDALCREIAGAPAAVRTSYGEAFQRHAGVDPHRATCEDVADTARRRGVQPPETIHSDNRDEWLNLLLATVVEPRLGATGPEIVYEYPASQSALAATRTRADGIEVAERFELYWRGVELANGYHELTDAAALREKLLAAMNNPGLPPCAGCALGFDRLVMLACGAASITDVIAFT
jgi:lysyl-tRNA synthetase class 2